MTGVTVPRIVEEPQGRHCAADVLSMATGPHKNGQ